MAPVSSPPLDVFSNGFSIGFSIGFLKLLNWDPEVPESVSRKFKFTVLPALIHCLPGVPDTDGSLQGTGPDGDSLPGEAATLMAGAGAREATRRCGGDWRSWQ